MIFCKNLTEFYHISLKNLHRFQSSAYGMYAHLQAYGPSHAKMCLMPYANNKGADQPSHPRSLISTFVVRCLDSIMPLVLYLKFQDSS